MIQPSRTNHVIYLPGVTDSSLGYRLFRKRLSKYRDLTIHLASINWKDTEPLETKISRVLTMIDTISEGGNTVSLVGASAGGTMALALYAKRPNIISKVVTICSPLSVDEQKQLDFIKSIQKYPALAGIVRDLPSILNSFSSAQMMSVLNFRSIYETVVPPHMSIVAGVNNVLIPSIGHAFTIGVAEVLYSKKIASFLLENL